MILAEIGLDMGRFPTAGHLVAWTGLCPGQNESGGKRKPARLRKGAPWLKARRGAPKAICAVAASLLTTIYHILKDGTAYCDLGANHFDKRPAQVKVNRLIAQLARLGYEANLRPVAQAA